MTGRSFIVVSLVVFSFLIVIARLADRMLVNHEWLAQKARGQQLRTEEIDIKRGFIYDRKGRELAVNLDVESLYCRPSHVRSPEKVARLVSAATGRDYPGVLDKVLAPKDFLWLERQLDPEIARSFRGLEMEGLGLLPAVKRFYPKGYLAAHVIGLAGVDNQPLEGIELSYEKLLSIESRKVLFARDAGGRLLSEGIDAPMEGNSLVLTIDEGLQYIVEKELDDWLLKWQTAEAVVVMMDPFTGEVLAMANRPTYDLNDPSAYPDSHRRNRALTDPIEPGSTFKLVVGSAVLEENLVTDEDLFDSTLGYIDIGGIRIRDHKNLGLLTFNEVIQKSSNVGAVMLGMRLGQERLYHYALRFGFGRKTGIDLPGEAAGLLKSASDWTDSSLGAVSIGYELGATPLQILRAYSAVANGGYLVRPHVVSRVITPEGKEISASGSNASPERILSPLVASRMRAILTSVTGEGGTAESPEEQWGRFAGKTGTTRIFDKEKNEYSTKDYISSFVGFAPADVPSLAMIVVVIKPRHEIYGGKVAAPLFRSIADKALAYLDTPVKKNNDKKLLMVRNYETTDDTYGSGRGLAGWFR